MLKEMKLFGRRLRAARKVAGISQERAAEEARLNPKYVGQLERGERSPSFEVIITLAKVFEVSPEIFFRFERDETDEKRLRQRIDELLRERRTDQLRQAHRVIRSMFEP
jgi:transcriptional regulator with XRE-family HTH domain